MDIQQTIVKPEEGLPEDLFLKISALTPIPNVDLFILNDNGELLLTWRNDPYFGEGWHLPGGCIRFRETMLDRVHKTAIGELGSDVSVDQEPIAVRDVIVNDYRSSLENQDIRAHHLAVLFRCYPKITADEFLRGIKSQSGWFKKIPTDILKVHEVYNDVFVECGLMG